MTSRPNYLHDGRLRQPVPTAEPLMLFDLPGEMKRLDSERPWQSGHTANTIVKYPDLRIILVSLRAGARLSEHNTVGRISIHCLSGRIRVCLPETFVELSAAQLLTLDREVSHELTAVEDSSFLLTIAWPGEDSAPHRIHAPALLEMVSRASVTTQAGMRELGLDKTLADTFPCSDSLSSIPDPVMTM